MEKLISKQTFTSADLAAFFKVKNDTAQKWLASGALASYRTQGGHFRIHRADLIQFLIDHKKHVPGLTSPFKTRILIVEDDHMTRRFLRRLLQQEFPDVEIHEAIEGFEAGYLADSLNPNLVVLDLLLPGLNGIRVCKLLRADKKFHGMKILAISGHRPDRIGRVIIRAGADLFMAKPLNNKEFAKAVRGLLELSLESGKK